MSIFKKPCEFVFCLFVTLSVVHISFASIPWGYDGDAGFLTNDVWSFKVSLADDSFTLVSVSAGSGELDLSDVKADTGFAVTKLGGDIFKNNASITGINGPDIISIGNSSFWSASGLITARFSPELSTIEYGAFNNCSNLETFYPTYIPNVTGLSGCILNCKKLTGDFHFPNLEKITGRSAFTGCAMTSFRAPKLKEIGTSETFSGCSSITNIEISSGITKFPAKFALKCYKLSNFSPSVFPNCTSIGVNAFASCSLLTNKFEFPVLETIGSSAFSGSGIRHLKSPNLLSIPSDAFNACANLEGDLYFDRADAIGYRAFQNCTKLTSVTAPNVSCVSSHSFNGCGAVTSAVFSASCTQVHYGVFNGCGALKNVYPFLAVSLNDDFGYWPGDKRYQGGVFNGCKSLSSDLVIDSDIITNIWPASFANCNAISNITIRTPLIDVISRQAFKNIASGANIWWKGKRAPKSIASEVFYPIGGATGNRIRVYVKGGEDLDGWLALCTRTADNLTESDLAREDYPNRERLLGVIESNSNYAWVIRWSEGDPTIFGLR